ncbi:MAG: LamG domain-containing protein [Desulfococcaceae bacterium]|jgi:hypothetical protein|nr:LamG domain-containing protein [Desulfococcaceae bacterium]
MIYKDNREKDNCGRKFRIFLKYILIIMSFLSITDTYSLWAEDMLPPGNALEFPGNSYVSVPLVTTVTDNVTLEAWIYWKGTSGVHQMIVNNGNGGSSGYGLYASRRDNSDNISIICGGVGYARASVQPKVNTWQHIAAVRDKGTWKLYLDGVQQALTGNPVPKVPAGVTNINDSGEHFQGRIDEVRIWETARTQAQINQYKNVVLKGNESGLKACFRFDHDSGTVLDNLLAGSSDGTLMNSPIWTASGAPLKFPPASLILDGANDYVSCGTAINLANKSFTIEFWAKRGSINTYDYIIGQEESHNTNKYLHIGFRSSNQFTFAFYANDLNTSAAYTDTEWHHWAVVYEAGKPNTETDRRIYRDGILVASDNASADYQGTGELKIGYAMDSNYFDGSIDEVRIWTVARSSEDIRTTMFTPLSGTETGLTAYYDCNQLDLSSTRLYDLAGQDSNGTLTNGTAWTDSTFGAYGSSLIGLWKGTISLEKVNEVGSDTPNLPTDVKNPFDMPILLHADAFGNVWLLRDVTLMKKTSGGKEYVLITDDTLLPNYEGIILRDGRLVGVRMGSSFFDFDRTENEHLMNEGNIAPDQQLNGTITLGKTHPTNPFRHLYHPDHKNYDPDKPEKGREVTRNFTLSFDSPAADDSPDVGVSVLKGSYRETITGIHKDSIIMEGSFTLNRISQIGFLNQ